MEARYRKSGTSTSKGVKTVRFVYQVRLVLPEQKIITMLIVGLTRKQIAYALRITPFAVKAHLARVYDKLGITSTWELVRWVMTEQKALFGGWCSADVHPVGCPCDAQLCTLIRSIPDRLGTIVAAIHGLNSSLLVVAANPALPPGVTIKEEGVT